MSDAQWDAIYEKKKSPKPGDLIFAFHKGVHQVIAVSSPSYAYGKSRRSVSYVQVADRHFNPITHNRRTQSCDILWTTPFEAAVRNDCYVNPEDIIQRVHAMVSKP